MKIILGIDPGSRITGYGVLAVDGPNQRYIASGTVRALEKDINVRLKHIFAGIQAVAQEYQPHEVAIEQVFMHRNANSAIKLGQARGAVIVASTAYGAEIAEYTPRQIKQAVVGYGAAEKSQVQQMVTRLLKLTEVPKEDAADALAAALCHAQMRGFRQLLKGKM